MEGELEQLRTLATEQDEVIGEMEGRISQMVEALKRPLTPPHIGDGRRGPIAEATGR